MKDDYVSNKVVENFHGDLTLFDEIRLLSEVDAGVSRTSEEARALRENAVKKVQEYSAQMANEREVASADSLDRLSSDIAEVNELIARVTAKLGEARSAQSANLIRDGIAKELDATQQRYNKLLARQDEIEILRQRVKLRNDIDALIPKVRTLRAIAEQRAEYEKKRYSVTTELEWQEKELNSVKQQLDECRSAPCQKRRQAYTPRSHQQRVDLHCIAVREKQKAKRNAGGAKRSATTFGKRKGDVPKQT